MIRLVATDMDGTLLDDKKNISPEFWETEKKLSEKGIIFCAASGRQYYSILNLFDRIRERVYFIAENGTLVVHNNEVLHINCLDKESARMLIEAGRNMEDAYVVLCCRESAYVEKSDERLLKEISHYYERIRVVDDLTLVEDDVLKVSTCDFRNAETNSLNYYRQFEQYYKVAIAGKKFLDVTHATANKGSAIQKLQEVLGISVEETLVFGDYPNDLEMLDMAKFNYAMKNAHPDILSKADYVTEYDNNNNGVVDIIQKLCLNGH